MRRPWIWTLPLALAGTAFWLSSRSTAPLDVNLAHPRDWFAHALEYAAMAYAFDLAVRWTWPGLPLYRRHLLLFAGLLLFGASDEIHQSFVPGRDSDIRDWVADGLGTWLGLALSCLPAFRSRSLGCVSWRRGEPERPAPGVPLILVADPHWSGELTNLEATTLAHPEADWLFLGDVFDVWVGVPGMESPLQLAFLGWVDERRAAGRWVGLWLGNREFFLDTRSGHFDLMGEGTGGALPREGLAWEHGDLVNAADWKYRIWNLLARSGPTWLFARLLPKAVMANLAHWLQRTLHTTNRAYKLAFPREAFRAAAAEHHPSVFLTGHFHTHELEGNGIALPWAHEGGFMVWREGRVEHLAKPTAP